MALTRPILIQVPAFDATQSYTFTFTVSGSSSQIVANKLVIREQDSNTIVYEEKQETFKYEHIVNADELTNGTYYNAVISTFDAEDNESVASVPIQFWCYTTPVIQFTNIPANRIINNGSFNFEFTYTQNENESLNSYIITLYNSSQVEIASSGLLYPVNGTPPFNGSYLFSGFENNTIYYIQISGTTIENTIINSSLQQFTVQYIRPDLFTLVQLTNNCDEGYITIRSNIIAIEGTSNPDPPKYINDQEIDLTENGSWVEWNQGYNIAGDMLTRVWFRNPTPYSQILQFSNTEGQTIIVNFMMGYENAQSSEIKAYAEAYVSSSLIEGLEYYIFSNYVTPLSNTESYTLYLTKEANIYQLQLLT